jgi:hypothetical protein
VRRTGRIYNGSTKNVHQSLMCLLVRYACFFLCRGGSHGVRIPRLRSMSILMGGHGASLLGGIRVRAPSLLRRASVTGQLLAGCSSGGVDIDECRIARHQRSGGNIAERIDSAGVLAGEKTVCRTSKLRRCFRDSACALHLHPSDCCSVSLCFSLNHYFVQE